MVVAVSFVGLAVVALSFAYTEAEWFWVVRTTFVTLTVSIWVLASFLDKSAAAVQSRGTFDQFWTWMTVTGGYFKNYWLIGSMTALGTHLVAAWRTELQLSNLISPFEYLAATIFGMWLMWSALQRLTLDALYYFIGIYAIWLGTIYPVLLYWAPYLAKRPEYSTYEQEVLLALSGVTAFSVLLAVVSFLCEKKVGSQWTPVMAMMLIAAVLGLVWGYKAFEMQQWFNRTPLLLASFGVFAWISIMKAEQGESKKWTTLIWRGYALYAMLALQINVPQIRDMFPQLVEPVEEWSVMPGVALSVIMTVAPTKRRRNGGG